MAKVIRSLATWKLGGTPPVAHPLAAWYDNYYGTLRYTEAVAHGRYKIWL